ncbi:hypothetical protein ACKWTF_015845 [Chironomus riparius]
MKCSACTNNECEGKYENREKCLGVKEKIECTCICQKTKKEANIATATSVGTGIATAAAGVSLTVMMAASIPVIIAGAAIVGAGSSLVLSPVQKHLSGECVTVKESAKEVALGATIGAITGPIGAAGSSFAKGASALMRFGIRAIAGASAGAVSGVVGEGARFMKGEEVTLSSVTKSVAMGAVVGTVGGASSQLASSVSSGVSNEVGQAVTRVAVQGTSAAATDAGLQLYQTGTIDAQQLILNTTGQVTVAGAAEFSSSMAQRTDAFNSKINNEKISSSNLSPEDAQKVKDIIKDANAGKLDGTKKVGDNNLHVLERDRAGQVAGDIGQSAENGKRGAGRAILENYKGKYVLVDHTMDHDYKGCKANVIVSNPLDATLRPDQVNVNILLNNETDDDRVDPFDSDNICDDKYEDKKNK